jgi:hypothetical protein
MSNSRGLEVNPCGTPVLILLRVRPNETELFSNRKRTISSILDDSIFLLSNSLISISRLTLSYAFFMSTNNAKTSFLAILDRRSDWVTSSLHVSIECWGLNPFWMWFMLFEAKYLS